MIPRLLHRVIPEHVPSEFEEFWCRWHTLHPGWEFREWRDPLNPADFETGYLWPSCVAGAQLAGLVRLEVLWRYGGVYVDMDMEPLRPIDDLLAHPCFIGTEDGHHLTDAMIGAEPQHPGIRACIDRLLTMEMRVGPSATGPLNTTAVLHDRPDVTILARKLIYPYHYHEKHRREEDFAHTSPESYAVHHWAASWT